MGFFVVFSGVLCSPLATAFVGPAGDYGGLMETFVGTERKCFHPLSDFIHLFKLQSHPPFLFCLSFAVSFFFLINSRSHFSGRDGPWMVHLNKHGFGMNLKQKSTMRSFLLLVFMSQSKVSLSSYTRTPCSSFQNFLFSVLVHFPYFMHVL